MSHQNLSKEKYTIGIVLAAGVGKRMNSKIPKVAHILLGKPLVIWAIESLIQAGVSKIVIVISPTQTMVEEIISNYKFSEETQIHFAYQDVPLGTGHAARCGVDSVTKYFDKEVSQNLNSLNILIAYGDTPAVKGSTFIEFLKYHSENKNAFSILVFKAKNPFGYGRIITDKNGEFLAICEEKDCSEDQKKIDLCNSGFLCANYLEMQKMFPLLKNENAAKEYYLTDLPILSKNSGKKVGYLIGKDELEFLGINSQEQLAEMEIKFKEKFSNK
ncbi:NTP transferase domain-containing protein [Silvanigrella paludirubra]|uniref:NTP transferase domain-containing protein n=1 Tax=Silvanigrella paludirubra TaxID=2499159 RepID=A0A6N6VTH7_9BACT|nr:NTP transferase domain-containing protein [Silvanigrella paludirubra]KAB8038856.1 NTP transferase domain-containing protein [Silvanigrella paludirubra]